MEVNLPLGHVAGNAHDVNVYSGGTYDAVGDCLEKWTVILKGPSGPHFEVVDADTADWSDDGKFLEFYDLEATTEALAAIVSLAGDPKKDWNPEEGKAELTRIFRTFGRIRVASFGREAVMGHFKGTKPGASAGGLEAILAAFTTWHPKLAELIAEHLARGVQSRTQVDQMLMSVTKLVEDSLRQALEEWIGGEVTATGGKGILDLAERHGLLKKGEPVLGLYRWFFAEPRNTSHHEFVAHPDATVVYWLGCVDTLLRDLDARKKKRTVPFEIVAPPQAAGPLSFSVRLPIGSGTVLAPDAKVEGLLILPARARDRVVKSFPLQAAGSAVWTGVYDTRDLPMGSASFSVKGADAAGPFYGSSGTVVTVTYGLCRNCAAPGANRGVPCSSCGK